MVRSLRVSDIIPLIIFMARSPVELARSRDRLCDGGWKLPSLFPLVSRSLVSGNSHCSYVCGQRARIDGLVYLNGCRSRTSWDIKNLLVIPGREEWCFELLEKLGSVDTSLGGRFFMRVEPGSQSFAMAKRAGFEHYQTEYLYCRPKDKYRNTGSSIGLRPKTGADEYGLFRLYSSAVPVRVRAMEGMTFQEWAERKNRYPGKEWVYEENGEIAATVRITHSGSIAQFDALSDPKTSIMGQLVDFCLSTIGPGSPTYCFVPETQMDLCRELESRDFGLVAECVCLSKETRVRIRDPRLVPMRA